MEDLKKIIEEGDEEARRMAVEALHRFAETDGVQEAAIVALKSLADESWRVRKSAATMLLSEPFIELEWLSQPLIEALRNDENAGLRNSSAEVLEKLGERSVESLIATLEDPDEDIRKFAVDILGAIGDKSAVPAIVGLLNDEDENVKGASGEALGKIGGPEVITALMAALDTEDIWLRFSALEALGSIDCLPGEVPVKPLAALIGDTVLKKAVIEALGSTGSLEAIEHLTGAFGEKGNAAKAAAVRSITKIYEHVGIDERKKVAKALAGSTTAEAITPMLLSHDNNVKTSAIKLLGIYGAETGNISGTEELLELAETDEFRQVIADAFIGMKEHAVVHLVEAFGKSPDKTRALICKLLGDTESPEAIDTLKLGLKDSYGHTRQSALISLGQLVAEKTLASIVELVADEYDDVEDAAVRAAIAVGRRHVHEVMEAVEKLKADKDPRVRKNVTTILGGLKSRELLPEVVGALKDESPDVRRAAATALGAMGFTEGLEHINVALADEDTHVRLAAVISLSSFNDKEASRLLGLTVTDEDIWVRCAALKALSAFPSIDTVKLVEDSLTDTSVPVVLSAIESLCMIAKKSNDDVSRAALNAAKRALRHPDENVSAAAKARIHEAEAS